MENLNSLELNKSNISAAEIFQMSNKDLYKKCQEFASKLAGLSNDAVDKILYLDKKLEDKPILRDKLQSGEIGYSKLRIIADIATSANQKMWAQKAEQMSKVTLETFVRGIKQQLEGENLKIGLAKAPNENVQTANDENCQKTMFQQECPGAVIPSHQQFFEKSNEDELVPFSFKLSRKMVARLKAYRVKLERARGRTLNWEDVFEQLLEGKNNKEKNFKKIIKKTSAEAYAERKKKEIPEAAPVPKKPSRHIPLAIKREIEQRSQGICEYPNCLKPAAHFHHTERFALTGRHTNIRNFCQAHHEIAHQGLIASEACEPTEWKLQLFPDLLEPKFEVDRVVRKYVLARK